MVGGLSWGYVGPSWGYVGPSWGYVGPSWGLCWPIFGLCWPILGLCWPILGLCWPILRPMLAHLEAYVGPCWPILSHKLRKTGKKGKSTKHCKTREFLAVPTCRRLGRRPLSYGEERTAVRQCHGQGAPGRIGLPPLPPTPETYFHSDPAMSEGPWPSGVRIPWALLRSGGSADQFRRSGLEREEDRHSYEKLAVFLLLPLLSPAFLLASRCFLRLQGTGCLFLLLLQDTSCQLSFYFCRPALLAANFLARSCR